MSMSSRDARDPQAPSFRAEKLTRDTAAEALAAAEKMLAAEQGEDA